MRALFTTYEGGGHVPPALTVARKLQERGAEVLFVSDEATRPAAERAGLPFEPWRTAPNRSVQAAADDPLEDWKARAPWGVVRAVCDAVMTGPAGRYAADTLDLIERFRPDVVVSMELLLGCMAAAERSGTPLALLTGNLWSLPTREDVPPFGPAFRASDAKWARNRDAFTRRLIGRWYDAGLPALNAARAQIGLAPLAHVLDQVDAAELILLGVARALDWGGAPPPASFVYAGPLLSVPEWVNETAPAAAADERPLVLASLSTTFQDQTPVMRRIIEAMGRLPIRGIATLGPAMRVEDVPRPPNVEVVASASHDELVPRCAAVVCHGGHGTVLRPLLYGVPVLCLPMGRDQPENAVRIAARGAGLTVPSGSSPGRIAAALRRLLDEPTYGEHARRLGSAVAAEIDGGLRAAEAIERLAAQRRRMV